MAKIAIIGGGVMGSALAKTLVDENFSVIVSDPDQNKLKKIEKPIETTNKNPEAAYQANVIILAVKPQEIDNVFNELKHLELKNRLIISIAAGVSIAKIQKGLKAQAIIRAMPNTPAVIAASATAFFANAETTPEQIEIAESVLGTFGLVVRVKSEDELDMITAVSGSGPAYFFLFCEELIKAAEKIGLNPEIARKLVLQTAIGSADLAQNSEDNISTLREKVTSKGGTTAAALDIFAKNKFGEVIEKAVEAAYKRAKELGK